MGVSRITASFYKSLLSSLCDIGCSFSQEPLTVKERGRKSTSSPSSSSFFFFEKMAPPKKWNTKNLHMFEHSMSLTHATCTTAHPRAHRPQLWNIITSVFVAVGPAEMAVEISQCKKRVAKQTRWQVNANHVVKRQDQHHPVEPHQEDSL